MLGSASNIPLPHIETLWHLKIFDSLEETDTSTRTTKKQAVMNVCELLTSSLDVKKPEDCEETEKHPHRAVLQHQSHRRLLLFPSELSFTSTSTRTEEELCRLAALWQEVRVFFVWEHKLKLSSSSVFCIQLHWCCGAEGSAFSSVAPSHLILTNKSRFTEDIWREKKLHFY